MRNPVRPSSCVTPAGAFNELNVQNKWEENAHKTRILLYPLKLPDGLAHAGCASGGTYGSSTTTNRKSRSPSRPEWLRRRQSRPSCLVWMQYVDPSPGTLRQTPHRTRPRLKTIGAQRKRSDHWMISYNRALVITRCDSIESTLRTRTDNPV